MRAPGCRNFVSLTDPVLGRVLCDKKELTADNIVRALPKSKYQPDILIQV